MNAFDQVSMFDFEWPPTFRLLAKIAAQLSFNFNFFHPECSVETKFNQKWMGFLAIPYLNMIPITLAYFLAALFTLPGWTGIPLRTKSWLLKNAYARVICISIILLLPF